MSSRRVVSATLLSFGLIASACGGSTSPDEDQAGAAADSSETTATSSTTTPTTAAPSTTATPTTALETTTTAAPTTTTTTTTEAPATSDRIDAEAVYAEPSDDPLIESVTQRMVADANPGPMTASEAEYRCISTRMVDDVGIRDILEASVSETGESDFDPAKLDDEDQDAMLDMLMTCVDIETLFAANMAADGDLTEEQAACLAKDLTERGLFVEIMRPLVRGDEVGDLSEQDTDIQEAMLDATLGCVDLVEQMATEFASDGTVSADSARCLAQTMDDEGLLEAIMSQEVAPDPEQDRANEAAFIEIARTCLTTEEFMAIGAE